jgi:hypothetical protein
MGDVRPEGEFDLNQTQRALDNFVVKSTFVSAQG